ncbi:uncharacterized protein LOC123219979 [Mangifera indica]|uniref:uncharacterized protein LOC123219965 n=1 Tax=Mangifera indica TaxID=29780 RepID=UPI001CF98ADC|nr:uncharacterized protein LOC123219965 [Mangifera indica]XP_044497895.1 uncharacterized protein LOC123219979 [Mangifera indica]
MKPNLLTPNSSYSFTPFLSIPAKNPVLIPKTSISLPKFLPLTSHLIRKHSLLPPVQFSTTTTTPQSSNEQSTSNPISESSVPDEVLQPQFNVQVASPIVPSYFPPAKLSLSDQAFFLLAFIACTTSVAFTSLVITAIPTLYAMSRAAASLAKLADTAREELPSTMAAIRLSGMEISDLTLELSDLSQEIADGVNKSAQAVQAVEAGIRQIGTLARQQTISMIQERASLPIISLQPVVAGAAKKTSHAVGQATKTIMNMISRGHFSSVNGDDNGIDSVEI